MLSTLRRALLPTGKNAEGQSLLGSSLTSIVVKARVASRLNIVYGACNIGLNFLLIPHYGLIGAAGTS